MRYPVVYESSGYSVSDVRPPSRYMYIDACIHILCSVQFSLFFTMPGGNGDIEVCAYIGLQPDLGQFYYITYELDEFGP